MTPQQFRELALSLPETTTRGDATYPDFQVRGTTFATIGPGGEWGVIKMTPDLQAELMHQEPEVFAACQGAWGRHGATIVALENAEEGSVFRALLTAWQKHAPHALSEKLDDQ